MKNRWGSYDDREQEEIEEEREKTHREMRCEGLPFCEFCLDERDLEDMVNHINKELDKEQK